MNSKKIISSWSGGKDSCLACYKAIQAGYEIKYLLNFISVEYNRVCFHGIVADLLRQQAELIGIPVSQKKVSADLSAYEHEFKEAVSGLKREGLADMVFGDVYLDEHKEWVERVCKDIGIHPIEPLWGIPAEKVVEEFIDAGFEAVVVSCNAAALGKEFIGKTLDRELLGKLKQMRVCPCGENGEFHTFVINGPIFKERIEITKSEVVLKESFAKYWFLDIQDYRISCLNQDRDFGVDREAKNNIIV